MNRSCIVVEHLSVEHAGTLRPLLEQNGFAVQSVAATAIDHFQDQVDAADLLVVMGGPIGVNDAVDYPFLKVEVDLLRRRLGSERATLGICLGSQLLANAAGAKVYRGAVGAEIGWESIELTDAGQLHPLSAFGGGTRVLHWHGDTFDLPPGAQLLASTSRYENQAFAIGTRILGLQFHIEITRDELEQWLVAFTNDLRDEKGETISKLRLDAGMFCDGLEKRNAIFVKRWIAQLWRR